jgi:hypothetical protein
MSNLATHKKALVSLLDYYEAEQYTPVIDDHYIMADIKHVLTLLRNMRRHIYNKHPEDDMTDAMDDLTELIQGVEKDEQNLNKLIYYRKHEVD